MIDKGEEDPQSDELLPPEDLEDPEWDSGDDDEDDGIEDDDDEDDLPF